MQNIPKIVRAAIKYQGQVYSLPAPHRHHHIISSIPDYDGTLEDSQGFVDANGKYLERGEAYQLAVSSGQIRRNPGTEEYQGTELFSEDLW